VPLLSHLDTQQQGEVDFSVKVKNNWDSAGTSVDNATITDEINISQTDQKFTVKVNSGLIISQKGYYQDSDILNSGSTPPKAGQATTYTINWQIKNYFSDARNVKVKAILPKNVNLTGQILPKIQASNFSFDSVSREIVWSAGNISAGTGISGSPAMIYFQVSLTPDNSQKGSIAPLIGQVNISGENQFTNTTITSQDSGIDTSLPDDLVSSGGGIVQ
jgi:hypothetical protein